MTLVFTTALQHCNAWENMHNSGEFVRSDDTPKILGLAVKITVCL